MLVYEDGTPEPVRIFDSGIEYSATPRLRRVPALLPHRRHRLAARRRDRADRRRARGLRATRSRPAPTPSSDRDLALDVLRMVEAAEASLARARARVDRARRRRDGAAPTERRTEHPISPGARTARPSAARAGAAIAPPPRVRAASRVVSTPPRPARPAHPPPAGRRRRARDHSSPSRSRCCSRRPARTTPGSLLALDGCRRSRSGSLLFKLYGLYDRDIKRISHTGLDDLPWLFHALLVGALGFWVCSKVLPVRADAPSLEARRLRRRRADR